MLKTVSLLKSEITKAATRLKKLTVIIIVCIEVIKIKFLSKYLFSEFASKYDLKIK